MVNNGRKYRVARCNSAVDNSSQSKKLNKLMAVELAMIETALYLDSYPENKSALNYYKKLIEEREKLSTELARAGRPMTHTDAGKGDNWNWVDSPWPWEAEANM